MGVREGNLSPGQFQYKTRQSGDLNSKEHHLTVGAFDPDTGEGIGQITAKRGSGTEGRYQIGTAYVRAPYQGMGVAQTALNVMNHELAPGAKIGHSKLLSPEGHAFAQRSGGHVPVDSPSTPSWPTGTSSAEELEENVRGTLIGTGKRVFGSPTMRDLAEKGTTSDVARFLTPAKREEPQPPEGVQGRMIRKYQGKEVVTKSALP